MSIPKKTILFLGGGRSNIGAVKAAKRLGYKVFVAGMPGNYVCYDLADKIISANIMDKHAVLNAIKDENIDGVLSCCSDRAINIVGCINSKYRLSGITENVANMCNNKYLMKERLTNANVNTSKYIRINKRNDLNQANLLRYPLIIKAVDLQSSNGVYKCNNFNEIIDNYQKVLSLTKKDYCIIEEFIEGIEIGAQAFVLNGRILFVLPHGDVLIDSNGSTAPIIHYSPLKVDNNTIEERVVHTCEQAVRAMGYNNCAVNIDLILKNGYPYVLELTGRVGANCLPELVSNYYGFNYYDLIVSTAVGDCNETYNFKGPEDKTILTRMIISEKSGKIVSINDYNNNQEYLSMFVKEGDYVNQFHNSSDCIGELLVTGNNLNDCLRKSEDLIENLHISIEKI